MEHEEIVNNIWGHLADISNKCYAWKHHVMQEVMLELSNKKEPGNVVKTLLNHNIIDSKGKLTADFKYLSVEDTEDFEKSVKELIHLGTVSEIRSKRLEQKDFDPGIFGIVKRLSKMSFVNAVNKCCSGHANENGLIVLIFNVDNPKAKLFHNKLVEVDRSNDYYRVKVELDEKYYKKPKLFILKKNLTDFDEITKAYSTNEKLTVEYHAILEKKKEVKNEELDKKFQNDALARFWEAVSRVINEFEYSPIQEKLDAEMFNVKNH